MPKVTLNISPDPNVNGNYLVVVDGVEFYGAGPNAEIAVRIRGDDEWFDDKLFNVTEPGLVSRLVGSGFNVSKSVPKGMLNEDWGQDEIYAEASVDGFGTIRSNTIKGKF